MESNNTCGSAANGSAVAYALNDMLYEFESAVVKAKVAIFAPPVEELKVNTTFNESPGWIVTGALKLSENGIGATPVMLALVIVVGVCPVFRNVTVFDKVWDIETIPKNSDCGACKLPGYTAVALMFANTVSLSLVMNRLTTFFIPIVAGQNSIGMCHVCPGMIIPVS